jgi:hypothetical protein
VVFLFDVEFAIDIFLSIFQPEMAMAVLPLPPWR